MLKNNKILLVFCNAPNTEVAHTIAKQIIERQLAACINILPHCDSIYRWENKIEKETEIPMLIKTNTKQLKKLMATIVALHPYDTPEIIAMPIHSGYLPYLQWINDECASD